MIDWIKIALACIGVVLCYIGVYHEGVKSGRGEGLHDGFLMALKAICDEDIKVDGRKFIFNKDRVKFYSVEAGKVIDEVDMDDLEFV